MLKILKLMLVSLIVTLSLKPALAESPEYDDFEGEVEHRIVRTPRPGLDIDVWIDKGEGVTYYPGEEIRVYFRASRDCYVVIYNLNTKGYVNILYPYSSADDPWIEGGRVYRIPGRYDDYSLTVDGPAGVEYIQALASFEPLSPPHWPGYYRGAEAEPEEMTVLRMDEDEDPYVFMEWVNHRIRPDYDFVTDICYFDVRYPHPRWYYWPHRYWYHTYPFPYYLGSVYFWAPFGVEVYIDGIFYGIAPITIPAIIIGRHYVTFYYNGCRVWNDYVYVERSKTVRVRAKIDERIRYVSEDPVKKDYRTWKEKEYRLVKERRPEPAEKHIRNWKDDFIDKSVRPDREKKSSERNRGFEQSKEGYGPESQTRERTKDRERDFVPGKGKVEQKEFRDKGLIPEKREMKERESKDRAPVPERGITREKESREGRTSQQKNYSAPKNPESSRYEQKREEVRQERTSRTSKVKVEAKRDRSERKR